MNSSNKLKERDMKAACCVQKLGSKKKAKHLHMEMLIEDNLFIGLEICQILEGNERVAAHI